MEALLHSGAEDVDLVQFIRANHSCLSHVDENGNNILQIVILESPHSIETIAYLLELRSSLTKHYNRKGWTPLYMAVMLQNIYIVDRIINVDPGAIYNTIHSVTPFQQAVRDGALEIVKCILTVDPKAIEQQDKYNASILHRATDFDIVNLLLRCKPELIDAVDIFGHTPVHYHLSLRLSGAPSSTYPNTLRLLLQKKPTLLNVKNNDGLIVLDIANRYENPWFVNTCFQCNPDLHYGHDGRDNCGNTVLHLVAKNVIDPELIVRMTHTRKSELWIHNKYNKTPLDIALHCGNTHVANEFRLYCPLDDTIASYHKHIPNDASIDMWALDQCSFFNSFLLTDLVLLTLSYLDIFPTKKRKRIF